MTRKLTLTFDNGPTPGITDGVLDTLSRFGLKSTFFLVGDELKRPGARDLAERARREGHWIGHHTATHGPPLGQDDDGDRAVAEIVGMKTLMGDLWDGNRYFRPNGSGRIGSHLLSTQARDILQSEHATVVLWTSVPRDRPVHISTTDAWIEQAKSDVLSTDWTVMVLHDRPAGHDAGEPMEHLGTFLDWCVEQGLEMRQDFPPSVVPMRAGSPEPWLNSIVT